MEPLPGQIAACSLELCGIRNDEQSNNKLEKQREACVHTHTALHTYTHKHTYKHTQTHTLFFPIWNTLAMHVHLGKLSNRKLIHL